MKSHDSFDGDLLFIGAFPLEMMQQQVENKNV
jgi:hypothetical protein